MKHRTFFQIPHKTFASIGIDPLAKDNRFIIKRPVFCCGFFILSFLFALASIVFCIRNSNDINEFAMVVALLNQLAIALWKIAVFVRKRHRIHRIIQDIWQWNDQANADEFQIISNMSSKNALISKIYYTTVLSTGVFGLLLPLIIKLLKLAKGLQGILEVPHKASYFWNTSTIIGYIAAYIWDTITIHFLINASVAIDTLFMWLVSNILLRFCILKKRLKTAGEHQQQTEFHKVFRDLINFHLHILRLAKELDTIFAEIIFVKSLISCTQICFLAFCLMSNNTSIVSRFYTFVFLLAVSMQLILYCYNGHLIEEESFMVSRVVFKCFKWSCMPAARQKMLQMIMVRSQKTSHITGIFFNLNLNLYLWFFKTAGSLIAVLNTLKDDQ